VRILGVIDLARGQAVHARGGDRERYAPVATIAGHVIEQGNALALAEAYHDLFGIDELYVADLDAITSQRPQLDVLTDLARRASIWLDAGMGHEDEAQCACHVAARPLVLAPIARLFGKVSGR